MFGVSPLAGWLAGRESGSVLPTHARPFHTCHHDLLRSLADAQKNAIRSILFPQRRFWAYYTTLSFGLENQIVQADKDHNTSPKIVKRFVVLPNVT